MRIGHWTAGLERRGAMEVGAHSGAHFQLAGLTKVIADVTDCAPTSRGPNDAYDLEEERL